MQRCEKCTERNSDVETDDVGWSKDSGIDKYQNIINRTDAEYKSPRSVKRHACLCYFGTDRQRQDRGQRGR